MDVFTKPIKQCVNGHSFCEKCIKPTHIKNCPVCREYIKDTRNYTLEQLIDSTNITFPCIYKANGCKFVLSKNELADHILECKKRNFKCEGKLYCGWSCEWEGNDIYDHFKVRHLDHSSLQYTSVVQVPFNDTANYKDIRIISAHYQLFWYKHKIDIDKKKAYWAFQFIGPKKNAHFYYYEFEIFNENESTRRFKITEYCKSDIDKIDTIFNTENCVAISFAMLKNYLNKDKMYSFRFRLLKKPKPDNRKPNQ